MKFGILHWNTHTADYPVEKQFQEIVELARATRNAGFDLFGTTHGHLQSPMRGFHPLLLLGALAPETGNMSLLTGIFQLALNNPVDMAEQTATLDVISGGRFIFGVGVGGREIRCAEFGVVPEHRGARTGESIQVIKRLWTEDEVTYQGQHFSLSGATLALKPVRKPHPPIWIGASASRAIRRAARLADAWYPTTGASLSDVENGLEIYRQGLEVHGRTAPTELPLRRDLYVDADQETAMREGGRYIRGPASMWRDVEYHPDRYFMGSPESIVGEIERYRERLGDLQWVFRVQWPGLPNNKVIEQVELLGSRVLPHFR